jgi:hypothetical protein
MEVLKIVKSVLWRLDMITWACCSCEMFLAHFSGKELFLPGFHMLQEGLWSGHPSSEELISIIAPLLDNNPPTPEMCHFFSSHCVLHPRSPIVADKLTSIAHRILKHNVVRSVSYYITWLE